MKYTRKSFRKLENKEKIFELRFVERIFFYEVLFVDL